MEGLAGQETGACGIVVALVGAEGVAACVIRRSRTRDPRFEGICVE